MMVEWLKRKREENILHLGQPGRDGGGKGFLVAYAYFGKRLCSEIARCVGCGRVSWGLLCQHV